MKNKLKGYSKILSNTGIRSSSIVDQIEEITGIGFINQENTIYNFGPGSNGQNGDNSTANRSSPVSAVGERQWNKAIIGSNGSNYVALDFSNFAYCWGTGTTGQLGNNLAVNQSSPVSVVGGRQFNVITAGPNSTVCALDSNGYAYCWGAGTLGQLGNNLAVNQSSPVSVVGGRQFNALLPFSSGMAALDSNNYAWTWGLGSAGVLGNNLGVNQSSPVSVVGGKQWLRLSIATGAFIGLDFSNRAWTWGNNGSGQLGDNTAASKSSPTSVVGNRQFVFVYASQNNAAAIDISNFAWTWGAGTNGLLGNNTAGANASSPVSVVGDRQFQMLALGNSHACGIDFGGYAWAWGFNTNGQLGDGTTAAKSSPVSVLGGHQFVFVKVDGTSTTGLKADGSLWRWGQNTTGALGDGTTQGRSSPVAVLMPIVKSSSPFKVFGK